MKFVMYPETWEKAIGQLEDAGHRRVEDLDEADFLVFNGSGGQFPKIPANVKYVQVAFAGVDALSESGVLTPELRWANAAGLYAESVAESTLAMLLSVLHHIPAVVRAQTWGIRELPDEKTNWLYDNKTLVVVGAGGIARRLFELLAGFGLHTVAVNRSGRTVEEADETVSYKELERALGVADYVVLLAPLTSETRGMIDTRALGLMKPEAVLVNVGRGGLVVTEDLVHALQQGTIAGAALDVTDPEPLPDGHPLWSMDNVLITPHVANTKDRMCTLSGELFVANARAFEAGETMPTEVDVVAGY
ncbi:D-isomer specific 2-hydroxyacid dehydrogenase family protein [Corynebacterium pseudotuberculosis]|uniref:D-isomer specific 2-hydroxyacid dehydrogenase family protein n=1 Tax=Corynebacterium pseudotuberculosis TaxID=1719 RepID=UPI0034E968D2